MRHLFLCTALSLAALGATAQTELGVFSATGRGAATPFVTDYHAIGINPANLNLTPEFEGKTVTFGMAEGAASMYSGFLNKTEVRNSLFRRPFDELDQAERAEYAKQMAGESTEVNMNLISAGFAINDDKLGGFAFSIRERITSNARFGQMASELIFLGRTAPYFNELILADGDTIPNTGNLSADTLNQVQQGIVAPEDALLFSQLLDGTAVGFSWIREFNLAYGKRLLKNDDIEVHGGIGAKLLVGNAWMQVDVDGTNVEAFSALSPVFGINYGEIANGNPSAFPADAPALRPVGLGWGIDLGATVVIKEKLLLSAAITDFGRMRWDGNLYELNDALFTEFTDPGAESADVINEVIDFASPESILEWKGSESRTTNLPTTARVGVGFVISEKLRLAADAVLPVNDNIVNYTDPVIAMGADLTPLSFLRVSAGFITGNNREPLIPAGISFLVNEGAWEFGFASRDLVTWFTNDNPTASLSWGFLRFRV